MQLDDTVATATSQAASCRCLPRHDAHGDLPLQNIPESRSVPPMEASVCLQVLQLDRWERYSPGVAVWVSQDGIVHTALQALEGLASLLCCWQPQDTLFLLFL